MKKILLFGGTFDPFHLGHLEIATKAKALLAFDEVWFILAKKPRWKRGVTPTNQRLGMLKAGIKNVEGFEISLIEVNNQTNTVNYTYDTVKELQKLYPDYQFSYLIGFDHVEKLNKWYKIDELLKLIDFVVVKRPGYLVNLELVKKYRLKLVDIEGPDISSTMIKEHFDASLLSKDVYDYIVKHQLYLEARAKTYMSKSRFEHSLSMAKLAKKIAKSNHINIKKCYTACILHDIAKEMDEKKANKLMKEFYPQYQNTPKVIHHQWLGAYLAKTDFNILDEEILSSISKHTTGSEVMSGIDKVVYCTDKIEPTRGYDSSSLIKACIDNIDQGYLIVLNENKKFLKSMKIDFYQEKGEEEIEMENKLKAIVKAIDDKKGSNIIAIDVSNVNPIVKYYVICDVTNIRQSEAVALAVEKALSEINYPIRRIEGRNGDKKWLLVDANDFIIHIFDSNERNRYKLEVLWGDQPQVDISKMIE